MRRIFPFILLLTLFSCENETSMGWHRRGNFTINGRKEFIVASNFPYYSYPPHSSTEKDDFRIWKDLLFQLKSSGINTLYISVPWIFHQPEQNPPDFLNDRRNLRALLRIAAESDFLVILNISPQSLENASGGGLPSWLQRYLYFLPENGDGKIALRTPDEDFINLFTSYGESLLDILFPFLHAYENPGNIFAVQIEGDLHRLKAVWFETLTYLGIPPSENMITKYRQNLINFFVKNYPDLTFLIEEESQLSNSQLIAGEKINQCVYGEEKPSFFKLLKSNPYEVLTASAAGFSGVIIPNFVTTLYPDDLQGWDRKSYPEGATEISPQPPVENGLISLYSPPSVTASELNLVARWLNEGFFPDHCRIVEWKTWRSSNDLDMENGIWWKYISSKRGREIFREWECRDSLMSILYTDEKELKIEISSRDFPSTIIENCRVLYAGKTTSTIYLIAEDSENCSISTTGSVKIIPNQWNKIDLTRIRFLTDSLVEISSSKNRGKILIYGFPPERLKHLSFLPRLNLLLKGIDYAVDIDGTLHIWGGKNGVIQRIGGDYPETVTTVNFSSAVSTAILTELYTLNETLFSDKYNPIYNRDNWLEGNAFEDYFSPSPYNYTSGFYWVYIPFRNTHGGNGYITLPSANGLFNIFLNGNYLGTILAYGEDVTVPFNRRQIKIGNNYIIIMALPVGSFPLDDPLYLNTLPAKFVPYQEYLTLFNFYHRPGFLGQGLVKVGEYTITLRGKWYFMKGLIGEKEKFYENFVNSLWSLKNLPLQVSSGNIVWVKKFIHTPDWNGNFLCRIDFAGENLFIRTYINNNLMGNLIPSIFASHPLKINGKSGTIILPVGGNQDLTIAAAITPAGKNEGTLRGIRVTFSKKEEEKWISQGY